jgi:hypothetical protein
MSPSAIPPNDYGDRLFSQPTNIKGIAQIEVAQQEPPLGHYRMGLELAAERQPVRPCTARLPHAARGAPLGLHGRAPALDLQQRQECYAAHRPSLADTTHQALRAQFPNVKVG